MEEFTELESEINRVKGRTAKGYACKDVAINWLFQEFSEVMEEKGFSWNGYLEVELPTECLSFTISVLFSIFTMNRRRVSRLCTRS